MANFDVQMDGARDYVLRLTVNQGDQSVANNESEVSWSLRAMGTWGSFGNYSTNWSVNIGGKAFSGSIASFDPNPSQTIASGTTTIEHNPDGTKTISCTGTWDSKHSNIGKGTASGSLKLTTLKGVPSTPTGVTATRVSDSSVQVSWSQSSPSNSQPTTNSVRGRVNGGSFASPVSVGATTSLTVSASANQKIEYQVSAANTAGASGWSATSAPVFTTPAAPTSVVASKDASLDINVGWVPHVGFSEHVHVVKHGTVTGGVTTWDGSPLASVAAGTTTFKHVAPDPSKVHVYRVSAKTTDSAGLESAGVLSNQVQLLVAPDKPTVPALPANADKGKDFVFPWVHNPVDTTAQTAYEVEYSTTGGSSWTSTGKVTSGTSSYTVAADTYTSGQALTLRVRTWGQASTGGSDGTGASPWSDPQTVTFKTRPTATVVDPADLSEWTQAALSVTFGFAQSEGATFVQATIVLSDVSGTLETKVTNTLSPTLLDTQVEDGGEYTVTVTVLDSNGLVSDPATSTFDVAYTLPVQAGLVVTYLREQGRAQLDLTFPEPGVDEVAAVAVTITRTIDGATETILSEYPIDGATMTVLDTTPTINGTNGYRVRTISADGATADTVQDLLTAEEYWAFLSTGPGYGDTISFMGDLKFTASPARAQALVRGAGRRRPIALFGEARDLTVSGSAVLVEELGSTPQEVEEFILDAGIVCYRDPSGRRMFGTVTGSVETPDSERSAFSYTVTEAS